MCICRKRFGVSFRLLPCRSQGEGTLAIGSLSRPPVSSYANLTTACLLCGGKSPLSFEKQLAQEAVLRSKVPPRVVNQVEVVERPNNGG